LPYKVILTNRAAKSYEHLPQETKHRVSEVLDALNETPVPFKSFDVSKLKGFGDTYRIRIGDWRIIYEFYSRKKMVVVHNVLRREKAYQ
jgi:mRNA interferase RelE/StbE